MAELASIKSNLILSPGTQVVALVEIRDADGRPVHVGSNRDRLLAIKRGEIPLGECEAWRRELHQEFDLALTNTKLPERPDYEAANAWLLRARLSMVDAASGN